MTPERFERITNVLQQRQPDLTVITDEVYKERNLAAIIRTCDAFGLPKVHCAIPREGYQYYSGISASSDKWVETVHYNDVKVPVEHLKEQGFQIVAAHLCETSVDFRTIDYTKPTALLLGAEVKGVSSFAEEHADNTIVVPMMGMVESFNVSVACAVILAEAQRQRLAVGAFETQKLGTLEYHTLFFRWAHPKLAEFCDDRSLDYPPVGDDGEVIDQPAWYASVRKQLGSTFEA